MQVQDKELRDSSWGSGMTQKSKLQDLEGREELQGVLATGEVPAGNSQGLGLGLGGGQGCLWASRLFPSHHVLEAHLLGCPGT